VNAIPAPAVSSSESGGSPSSAQPNASSRNPWLVLGVVCLGFFMNLLDVTIVNVALPSMASGLGASLDQLLWVLNAYILTYAVLLITAGRLGDLLGQRTIYLLGLAVFTAASALAGFAGDATHLIAARALQGAGAALLTPQTLAILTAVFPPRMRGAAFGVWGAVSGVATVVGPTLGGFLVTHAGWQWIFFVNVPIGLVALVAAVRVVPNIHWKQTHRFDLVGVGLLSIGLLAVVFGLVEGEPFHWGVVRGPLTIPWLICSGVFVLGAFAVWERTQDEPLVPRALLGDRNYVLMCWVQLAMSFGVLGVFLPLTVFLQSVLGLDALQAGLTIVPMALANVLVAPFGGQLAERKGGKWVLVVGLALFATGIGAIAALASTTGSPLMLIPPLVIMGVGMGCVWAPIAAIAMRRVEPYSTGAASGVLSTAGQIGDLLGAAVVGAILENRLASSLPSTSYAASYVAALSPTLLAPIVVLLAASVSCVAIVGHARSRGL
jgi:EmrB/QacA subfamily drug resistance transporter